MYIHIYVYSYMCTCICICICICITYDYIDMYAFHGNYGMYIDLQSQAHTHAFSCKQTYACMYIQVYVHTNKYIYVHT